MSVALVTGSGGLVGSELVEGGGDSVELELGVVGGIAFDGGEGVEGLDVVGEYRGRDAASGWCWIQESVYLLRLRN